MKSTSPIGTTTIFDFNIAMSFRRKEPFIGSAGPDFRLDPLGTFWTPTDIGISSGIQINPRIDAAALEMNA
jgi:hypothetical protein